MQLQKIPFRSTHAFTEFFLKYIEKHTELKPFYGHYPSVESFKAQIKLKSSFPDSTRKVLVDSLRRQYQGIKSAPEVDQNIQSLLKSNTFTVTTGHQLATFTGPLYFIYKIITAIKTCRVLKQQYPDAHFVPVYWMASEDHDYEEIKSFRLYGKKYTWETNQQGAVGRFHTKDMKALLDQVPGAIDLFREAYTKGKTLSEAVRMLVHALFKSEGLVVIDADDRSLKELLKPVIRDDIFKHTPNTRVTETNKQLESLGLHPQVNPREINFFYLDAGLRSRIERAGDSFVVVDTPMSFSAASLEKKIEDNPEMFSPNVILRPLYQEIILPNLAYIGGPAELVYWLELKGVFEHFGVPFPILLPRNFALVVDAPTSRKLSRTNLPLDAFFSDKNTLNNRWVAQHSQNELSLDREIKALDALMNQVKSRCEIVDASLSPMAEAQQVRMKKMMATMEKKLLRAEKRRYSDSLRQIEAVKDTLYPNGNLQERTDNFLNFSQQDPSFIDHLLEYFDPFDFQFNVLSYHDKKGTA